MSNEDLFQILEKSNKNNRACDISGILIYLRDRFIQILEGEKEAVENMFEKIDNDERHGHVSVLLTGYNTDRLFPEWSMAFKFSDEDEFHEITGLKNLDEIPELGDVTNESHPALIFVRHFKDKALQHYEFQLGN